MAARGLVLAGLGLGVVSAANCQANCSSGVCTFNARVDIHASSTGYYKFAECGDEPHPTIEMKQGVQYRFVQDDDTNWYHPLGFAYFPDGAILGVDELEPGISHSGSSKGGVSCVDDNTCQAPRYFNNGVFAGVDFDNTAMPAVGGDNFGLDDYEPAFQLGRGDWQAERDNGGFKVEVMLTDTNYAKDLFYFCHIHGGMSGRIVVVDESGNAVNMMPGSPPLSYGRELPSDFDKTCGTYGIGEFTQKGGMCSPDLFCDSEDHPDPHFGECMYALDCHMNHYMRVDLDANPLTAFVHQMIPHHENAVNMAKLLLKKGIPADQDPEGEMEEMMWSIVNGQNAQITFMRNWLTEYGYQSSTDAQCGALKDMEPVSKSKTEINFNFGGMLAGLME